MFVQSTSRVGAIAELEIATAAVRAGLTVLRPVAEQARYDLALEIGPRLFRVQCKSGALDQRAGVIKVGLQSTWYSPQGYVRTTYSTREIDLVGVYCAAVDRSYLLPAALVTDRRAIWLRLRPPRNHQRAAINSASRYEFAGAVAQLEERDTGSVEATGSSPVSSTSPPDAPQSTVVGAHEFRNHFGYSMERAAAGEDVVVNRRGRPLVRLSAAAPALPAASLTSAMASTNEPRREAGLVRPEMPLGARGADHP